VNVILWEPSYVRLPQEQARAKIKALCDFCDTYRTEYNPDAARALNLGHSAYCYRHLDEAALVAFEAELMGIEPQEPKPEDTRAARNRRYYLARKLRKAEKEALLAS